MINLRIISVDNRTTTPLFTHASYNKTEKHNLAFRIVGPIGKIFVFDQVEKKSTKDALVRYGHFITSSILDDDALIKLFEDSKEEIIAESNLQLPPPTIALSTMLRILERKYEEKNYAQL